MKRPVAEQRKRIKRASPPPPAKNSMVRLAIIAAGLSALILLLLVVLLPPPPPATEPRTDASFSVAASAEADAEPDAAPPAPSHASIVLPTTPVEIDTAAEQKQLLDQVERAAERYPDDASVFRIGGLAYKELLQTDRAGELFRRSLELDDQNAEVLGAYAGLLRQLGKHEEAVSVLSRAVERGVATAPLLTALGEAYSETGDLEAAAKWLEKAVAAAPEAPAAHLALAQALVQLQRFADAEKEARLALRSEPNNRAATMALSTALIRQDKKEEALKLRAQMPKIDAQVMPNDQQYQASFRTFAASTYFLLAGVYASHDAAGEAEQLARHSLELDPKSIGSAVLLGELLRRQGRLQDSLVVYQRLTELQPENLVNFHNLASLAVSLGDLALAEQTLRRAAQVDPSGNGELQLARLLLGLGNAPEAAQRAQKAADQLASVDAYLVLIAAHQANGDKAEALKAYMKAKRSFPSDPRLAAFTP